MIKNKKSHIKPKSHTSARKRSGTKRSGTKRSGTKRSGTKRSGTKRSGPARKRSKRSGRKRSKRSERSGPARKRSKRSGRKRSKRSGTASNGMMTKVWGPTGWVFLHSCVMGYPLKINEKNPEDRKRKKKTKVFFETIGHIFPCIYCRESYQRFIKELPIDKFLESRRKLANWLYQIHNKVNKKLGVPRCDIPSFNEVYGRYETYRAQCEKTTQKDRRERKEKGCVIPKDGKKKKCIVKVVNLK